MAKDSSTQAASGMPQLDFSTFPNQGFWLLITIFCLFLMVRLLIIPRMDNILTNRRKVIEEDLVGAEKFRDAAEALKGSISQEVDAARIRANDIVSKSKEKNKLTHENGIKEATEMTKKLVIESEKNIQKMQQEAKSKIDKISEELAPKIVAKVFSNDN